MRRIFTILAFTVLAIISFGQSSYEYEMEYIYDETTGDTTEFIHIYGEIEIDTTVEYVGDPIEYVKPYPVEEIKAAPFEIEGGMVYSWGTIKVYDITGRLVATASQSFNVNTLKHTMVYIIVAEEGVIKYNGAWVTYGAETREQMKRIQEQIKYNDFLNRKCVTNR